MTLLLGALMLFASGLIRGFTGFGFAIAAMPLLSLLAPPAAMVPVVLLLQLAISLQGLRGAWAVADRGSLRWLLPGALLATPLGLAVLAWLPADAARLIIAALVVLTVAVLAGGFRLRTTPRGPAVALVGVASGLCNGLAAMPGPPVIAYYLATPLRVEAARGAMILLFMLTALFGLLPLLLAGRIPGEAWSLAAAGLPVVWGGSWLGAWLYRRSPDAAYRRIALWALAGSAAAAALRALL